MMKTEHQPATRAPGGCRRSTRGWGRPGGSNVSLPAPRGRRSVARVGRTRARRTVWGICTVLCVLTGLYALSFVASGFANVPDDVAANSFLSPGGLRLHIAVTAVAVIVAPWQFAQGLRDRIP